MAIESTFSLDTQQCPKAILVVEDDVSLRIALAEWFRLQGYTVYEAATADEAVVLLGTPISIHLVITDIDMPGTMNGLDLVHLVELEAPGTPVILVSGQEQPIEGRAAAFFRKPYDLQEILSLIGKILATKSPEADFE